MLSHTHTLQLHCTIQPSKVASTTNDGTPWRGSPSTLLFTSCTTGFSVSVRPLDGPKKSHQVNDHNTRSMFFTVMGSANQANQYGKNERGCTALSLENDFRITFRIHFRTVSLQAAASDAAEVFGADRNLVSPPVEDLVRTNDAEVFFLCDNDLFCSTAQHSTTIVGTHTHKKTRTRKHKRTRTRRWWWQGRAIQTTIWGRQQRKAR